MKLNLLLLTKDKGQNQLLGDLFLNQGFRRLFECKVLQRYPGISPGTYKVTRYFSPKLKRTVLLLHNVPGHEFIEIHHGNFYKDTSLCFLTGSGFTDMDGDGLQDVTDSVNTLERLLALIPEEGCDINIFGNARL